MSSMSWYSLTCLLAAVILIIVNYDILFRRGDSQKFPEVGIYRKFLYGIMSYYITDILWGVLDSLHLTTLLFLDTVVYYVAMAVGVLFWTQYVVLYLAEENAFSRFLAYTGRIFFAVVAAITVINCFTPVLFWFDVNLGRGELQNANIKIREKSNESTMYIHRSPIDIGDFWETIEESMKNSFKNLK